MAKIAAASRVRLLNTLASNYRLHVVELVNCLGNQVHVSNRA